MSETKYSETPIQTLQRYKEVSEILRQLGMNPVLYGAVGVSVYLGDFRKFQDIDFLVEDEFLNERWEETKRHLEEKGFKLEDAKKEHEFINAADVKIALGKQSVLEKDGIGSVQTDSRTVNKLGIEVRTLSPEAFLRAYEFSSKATYMDRKNKDQDVIRRLRQYIGTTSL